MKAWTQILRVLKLGAAALLAAGVLAASLQPFTFAQAAVLGVIDRLTFPAGSFPAGLTYGPQGKYWFTLSGSGAIAEWQPLAGVPVAYNLGSPSASPRGITIGPDLNMWVAEKVAGKVARFEPGYTLTEFDLPSVTSQPSQIVTGQDGAVWFTQFNRNSLGRITVEGEITEFVIPTHNSKPLGLASDLDGSLWFCEWNGYKIGKLTMDGVLTEYAIASPPSRPSQIVLGPDLALWFTYEQYKQVGRIDPAAGTITNYPLPTTSSAITSLAVGADGRLWFLGTQTVGSFDAGPGGPAGLIEVPLPTTVFEGQGGNQIIAGPNGVMNFITSNTQKVYEVGPVDPQMRDLQVFIVDAPPFLLAGGAFTVDARLANWSSAPAANTALTFSVSEGLEFISADAPALTCAPLDPQTMQCTHAALPGGSVSEVLFTLQTTRTAVSHSPSLLDLRVESAEGDYLRANNRTYRVLDALQQYVYQTDFSAGADSLWSHDDIATVDGQDGLGLFDNHKVSLQLPKMPPHDMAAVCFDLYVLGGWDGDALVDPESAETPPPIIGPDIWANYMNDARLLVASFSNRAGFMQSYPQDYGGGEHAAQTGARTGEFDANPTVIDARYSLCTTQPHNLSQFIMTFYGLNLNGAENEKWALDNVKVRIYYEKAFDYVYLPILWK